MSEISRLAKTTLQVKDRLKRIFSPFLEGGFEKFFDNLYTGKLNPITGTHGGLFGLDHQIIDHNSKTALSITSKLGDFLFFIY